MPHKGGAKLIKFFIPATPCIIFSFRDAEVPYLIRARVHYYIIVVKLSDWYVFRAKCFLFWRFCRKFASSIKPNNDETVIFLCIVLRFDRHGWRSAIQQIQPNAQSYGVFRPLGKTRGLFQTQCATQAHGVF